MPTLFNASNKQTRKVNRNGNTVTVSALDGEVLHEHTSKSELTAAAYLHYTLLLYADQGYKPL